jgi:hypothetical protein
MEILDIFRDIASEFSTESDEVVNRFILYSQAEISTDYFADELIYKQAVAYLSASKLKIKKNSTMLGAGGVVMGQRAGNIELRPVINNAIKFKNINDNPYQTEYEKLLLNERNKSLFVVASDYDN